MSSLLTDGQIYTVLACVATVVFSLSTLSMKASKMATRNLSGCSRTDLVAMEIRVILLI